MRLFIGLDDIVFDSTRYYEKYLRDYGRIVTEFTDESMYFRTNQCPRLEALIEISNHLLPEQYAHFRTALHRSIVHSYENWPKRLLMGGYADTGEALGELYDRKLPVTLVGIGDRRMLEPSIAHHDLTEYFSVLSVQEITSASLTELLSESNVRKEDALFVGNSPRRELVTALEFGLNVARVQYFSHEDELPLPETVPVYSSLTDFVVSYLGVLGDTAT